MAYASRDQVELKRVSEAVLWAGRTLELSDQEVGDALGVTGRSIARWREARNQPSGRHVAAAEQLLELAQALDAAFGGDARAMQEWLHQPLPALRRQAPLRAVISGHVGDVLAVLASAESGTFA